MAKKNLTRGLFITFEGPEGCGKSTHSRLIYDHLRKKFPGCVHTREPGGTDLGERIRELLLHSGCAAISDLAELFLFEAARAQIITEIIRPGLAAKKIVICDRFSDATMSYQGYGSHIPLEVIMRVDAAATGGIKPDITILLDIDTVSGLRRARAKGIDRMEKKDVAYHRRVRAGYLKLAAREPGRIKVIRATGSIEDTQQLVRREVERVIQKYIRA